MSLTSSYLQHLPAPFSQDEFVGRFLLAFEAVLTGGVPGVEEAGLEEVIGGSSRPNLSRLGLADYYDPLSAPPQFLPWLAGWVALSVRADWDDDTTSGFIREVVPLYRMRGTLAGLQRILQIYLRPLSSTVGGDDVVIFDDFEELPHFFQVRLTLADNDPVRLRATQQTARAIIEQEKPAHTFFALKVVIPTMRLVSLKLQQAQGGNQPLLILGTNTWLGTAQ